MLTLDQHKFICGGFSFKHKHANFGPSSIHKRKKKDKKRSKKGEEVNYLDLSVDHYVNVEKIKHDFLGFTILLVLYIYEVYFLTQTQWSQKSCYISQLDF